MQLSIVDSARIDKFLWAARFYKTRSLAADELGKGRIKINGLVAKASREVKVGDRLEILRDGLVTVVDLLQISEQRGPASLAQSLYRETQESTAARDKAAQMRCYAREPALSIAQGRPTKRERRALGDAREQAQWNDRWSAQIH